MNKEIKISLIDLYIGYAAAAIVMYTIGGIAYSVGKTKGKLEVADKIREAMHTAKLESRNSQSV